MKKGLTRALAAMLLLALVLVPALALAESESDTAGNELFSPDLTGKAVELDAYGTGETVAVQSATVGGSALLAGKDLMISDSSIGGSLRAAGYSIVANNTQLGANATVAGYTITLGNGFSARGVYAAAATVNFSGNCDALYAAAETVTLNGTVNGDATISAGTVLIGDDAVVTGTLHITAAEEPAIPANAKIGSLSFTKSESTDVQETAAQVGATIGLLSKLRKLIMYIPGRILLAVLYFFVIGGTVKKSGDMLKKRPAPMLLSGLIALIAAPVAILILLCTYIGIPVAMLLLVLLTLAMGFAISFTACAVGQLVFPKMHGLLASIIGVAAFSLLGLVPVLGGILTFACMLYTVGYFIQTVFLGWTKKKPAEAAVAEAPAESGAAAV